MAKCAFCDRDFPKLTKEHLWPAALHQRINAANENLFGQKNTFYLDRINKTIDGEPQVKDVCAECNNGSLSSLDGYICHLWDQYFHHIVEADKQIAFDYDYHLLARWLLKLCFNSARIHKSDVKHLKKCREYVLSGANHPDHVVVHVQLAVPTALSDQEQFWARSQGLGATNYEPRLNRVGHLKYRTRFGYFRVTRAVHLQSFMFVVHLFPDNVDKERREADLQDFAQRLPNAERMPVQIGISTCRLTCKGLDAMQSIATHFAMKQLHEKAHDE